MRSTSVRRPALAVLLLAAGLAGAAALRAEDAAPAIADAKADAVAAQVMQALGGQAAWDSTRYLRFTFAGRRTHTWDRSTGRHRVEGKSRDGKSFVILENLGTHQGRAWVDGKEAAGDELKKMLETGYGTWVNDTYWLLMPYKLKDPGVHLAYAGEDTIGGKAYDKLALSFDHVGLDPRRPLHGLDQPRHPPDGPLDVRPREHEADRPAGRLGLDGLAALRRHRARPPPHHGRQRRQARAVGHRRPGERPRRRLHGPRGIHGIQMIRGR